MNKSLRNKAQKQPTSFIDVIFGLKFVVESSSCLIFDAKSRSVVK